ncbi:MAG: response regulator transcription factor [Tannerellaceae bacterium]|nr:response regulator transcription factor [Tannerellaceae bacterium]
MKTFILTDNQDIARIGIEFLLRQAPIQAETIEKAGNKTELEVLIGKYPDSIVILDPAFSDFLNENILTGLHNRYPAIQWLVFSDDIDEDLLHQYCANPRFSFVLKRCEVNEINAALKYALKGENFICNPITRMLLHYRRTTENTGVHLTQTEKEILKLIALGRSAKEIANERNSSVYTIITHKKNIFRKLEVNNIHEATKYALRAGLIDTIEYYI